MPAVSTRPPAVLAGLASTVLADPFFTGLAEQAGAPAKTIVGPPGVRPFVAAALASAERPVLLVTATGREAEVATDALTDLLGAGAAMIFPSWETLPHERLSPRADTVGKRLAVLRRLAHPEAQDGPAGAVHPLQIVVTTVRSLIQPMAPNLGEIVPVRLQVGDETDLGELVSRLVDLAYTRVDMVEKRGELAVRGGILDVFPPTASHPVRVEFWGDEVTELREFAVTDQRSLGPVELLEAAPCREILLTEDVRRHAGALSSAATGDPTLAEMLAKIASGVGVEGMESLLPALMPGRLVM
ncbi:MAG: transcription-repair coupling factor, partial [Actinomycetota bacterium]|nr:transcription-repair coupling factor [Actinomycetota bacterium]